MFLLEVLLRPFFVTPSYLAFASLASTPADDLESNYGFAVGVGRRKARFVRYPDGEFRPVDLDFDPSVFDDPDSIPNSERRIIQASVLDVPSDAHTDESIRTIAESMLSARPLSLVAVVHDSKGVVIGATITTAQRGLTPATFRASFRSMPSRGKQVTFAAGQPIPPDIQRAVSEIADVALVRVINFLVIE